MTEQTTSEDKAQTVLEDMDQRRLFDSTDEATAYIQKCQTDFSDFGNFPVAAVGLTDAGDFDPEIYHDGMQVAVSVVTKRGDGPNSTTVHCITIWPAPRLESILEDAQGREWLTGIMEKELNHVAVRQIRKATDAAEIAEAVGSMPSSVADFTTSGRESTSGILETYNQLWQVIKKGMGAKSKPWALRNFSKKEMRKAMESASYASAVYPNIEDRTNSKGEKESLFVLAIMFGQMLAKQESLDPTIFDRMAAHRDERDIAVQDDEEEFDLEAMAASLVQPAETEDAETVEA